MRRRYVYIISIPCRAKKNIFKFGKHDGTKKTLFNRHKTALINPVIYFFEAVDDYTMIETMVKQDLCDHRIQYPDGGLSEWINLPLSEIIECVYDMIKLYNDNVEPDDITMNEIREDNENLEKDFLLKNSDIPCNAIDILYHILSIAKNKKDICIDLELIIKILECRKDNIKRNLVKYFSKNIDYNVRNIKIPHKTYRGGTHSERIHISLVCFKELCVVSNISKAKKIRNYCLQTEKLLREYEKNIFAVFN